ncbi:YIEGIA family protein [Tumebacillus flagellatus]|uniref:Membrane protein n=1 Tax=Tumebacillus flagellatus TaxID=1157490 RepID=A0A074MCS8_9BACL|nr:YIEGIA family protein [Tumebacillus flagellatus]KEO83677.1 membrane protein [Tumebacillus flagellatus]
MSEFTRIIFVGSVMGIICRMWLLRTDYRQYPTYPHGKIIHLALGVIASGLGSVLVATLLDKNYTAVTFLTLAAQQFRDVRNMERQMLTNVDELELVPRGLTYIEGIAMAFEGRNYLVIATAFFTGIATHFWHWYGGGLVGIVCIVIAVKYMAGRTIAFIGNVREGQVRFEGPNLFVDDILIYNTGLKDTQQKILKHGVGLILEPKNANATVTFSNLGQRQAILHDVATILGVYRDSGEPSLVPLSKRDLDSGRLAIFLLPLDRDVEKAKAIVRRAPVLENAYRRPLKLTGKVKPDHHL